MQHRSRAGAGYGRRWQNHTKHVLIMRFLFAFAALCLVLAGNAWAEDDFGARFGDRAPPALSERPQPENIEPAAGASAAQPPQAPTQAPLSAEEAKDPADAPLPSPSSPAAAKPPG